MTTGRSHRHDRGPLTPVAVPGLGGVTMISAGGAFTLALKGDGTVWSWGGNDSGELGDGTFTDRLRPGAVAGLPLPARAISAGGSHALALLSDGTVWAWGYNGNLLGDGSSYTRATPGPVSNLAGVIAISAGSSFSLALKSDGTVWSWGYNDVGQLGDGTVVSRSTPVQVAGLAGVDRVSAGYSHALAHKADGSLWAWGDDAVGELGDNTLMERLTPASVAGLSGVTAIAAGDFHVLALKSDGTVWAWGANAESELGDGTTLNRSTPAQVPGVAGVTAIASGGGHSIALKSDATLVTWGSNGAGQLGYGNNGYTDGLPAPVPRFGGVTAISAGYAHSVAVRNDGTVWTWGSNDSGELGDGTTTERDSPIQVPGLGGVRAVSAGNAHTLALKSDGTLWAWGNNASGQLGDGTRTDRLNPVQVTGLSNVVAISGGGSYSLALRSDGSVWAWGDNEVGTLGDGTTDARLAPVRVAGIPAAASISAGRAVYYGHGVAAASDGTVWAWGDYRNGQLGDGTVAERVLPVIVVSVGGAGSIAANDWFLDLDPSRSKQIPPDRIPALLVLAAGNTRGALVEVQANVRFRGQDVGNPIYVFGYVPASLVKRGRAGKDDATCVLAQITPAGIPQQATASSLQGYVSNVVSTQGQAVTVLNGVTASTIAGSTFCVGTAADSGQAVSASNSTCVATVPPAASGSPVCFPPGSAAAITANSPGALSGLWWSSTESGWGIDFTQRRDVVFAAWYTYDSTGNPKWYVASDCRMPAAGVTSGACNGSLYEVNGPTFFGSPFNPSAVQVATAGSLTVSFQDPDNASMTYRVGSQTRTVAITRQPISGGTTPPAVDYTDLWWNPNESGWGMSVAQQFNVMFLAWLSPVLSVWPEISSFRLAVDLEQVRHLVERGGARGLDVRLVGVEVDAVDAHHALGRERFGHVGRLHHHHLVGHLLRHHHVDDDDGIVGIEVHGLRVLDVLRLPVVGDIHGDGHGLAVLGARPREDSHALRPGQPEIGPREVGLRLPALVVERVGPVAILERCVVRQDRDARFPELPARSCGRSRARCAPTAPCRRRA